MSNSLIEMLLKQGATPARSLDTITGSGRFEVYEGLPPKEPLRQPVKKILIQAFGADIMALVVGDVKRVIILGQGDSWTLYDANESE